MGRRIPNGRPPARAARQLSVATPGARSSRQATEKGPLRAGKRSRNWGTGVAKKHSARLAKRPAQSRSGRLKPEPSTSAAGARPQTSLSRSFPNPGAALQKQKSGCSQLRKRQEPFPGAPPRMQTPTLLARSIDAAANAPGEQILQPKCRTFRTPVYDGAPAKDSSELPLHEGLQCPPR